MAPDTLKQHSMCNLAGTVAAYLTLNPTLHIMNKWLLGIYGFSFPLLLTSCHMLFSFLILLPFMLRASFKSLHVPTLQKQWKGIIGIGLFMAVNIAFNNLSLVQITLSLNQVISHVVPACVACVSAPVALSFAAYIAWYFFPLHPLLPMQVFHTGYILAIFIEIRSLCERSCIPNHTLPWSHDSCMGGQCEWQPARHDVVHHGHCMQCCNDEYLRQNSVRKAGCAEVGVLHCASLLPGPVSILLRP